MSEVVEGNRSGIRMKIIDAAWKTAEELGLSNMTIQLVAEETGVEPSELQWHFATEDDLLKGLLNDDSAQLESVLYKLEAARLPGAHRLSLFFKASLEFGADPTKSHVRRELWSLVLSRPELGVWLAERIKGRRTILRGWIDRIVEEEHLHQVPANALASVLLALSDGLTLHSSVDPTAFRWENVNLAVDAMLGILRPE